MAMTPDELRDLQVLVDMKTVAEAMDMNYQSVLRLIKLNEFPLPVVQVGKRNFVRKVDLLEFLKIDPTPDNT